MIERFPHVYYIVSSTTRPPRVNEIDNKDYHFITNKEFLNKIIHNEMLEWTQFRN
jgi:guanylate kinase